jgi:hypothetical protein
MCVLAQAFLDLKGGCDSLRPPLCPCDVPSPALFDLGNVELEEVVQPGDEFLST